MSYDTEYIEPIKLLVDCLFSRRKASKQEI